MQTTKLIESYVQLLPHGAAEVVPKGGLGVTAQMPGTIVWDPQVGGLLVSEAVMNESSRHQGERHLDGDEVVYLISGSAQIAIEGDGGAREHVDLQPGVAAVVPLGAWHRVLIHEPSRLLFLNSGRTEIRPPAAAS